MNQIARHSVWNFFENPTSTLAWLFRSLIVALVLYSVTAVVVEFLYPEIAAQYAHILFGMELFLVVVFSVEYLLRLWSSPSKRVFAFDFYNVIDLFAILPIFLFGTNIAFVRALRIVRLFRAARLVRFLGRISAADPSRVVQENVVKNISLIACIFLLYNPLDTFLRSVEPEALSDVMFAVSILALAAMFGFFSLSHRDFDPTRTLQRALVHLTTACLLLPIGTMFLIVHIVLTIQLAVFPTIIVFGVWFVYAGVVLWDFVNVLRLYEKMTNTSNSRVV